ncbi:MAG: histidine phosphatase family protein [Gammaproteobacteria bacterium]|nr:histidine phosphatase family protein [Gammaproteobacteria bacterium]
MNTIISLIRHGHVHNPRNISYGRLPGFPLSEKGCRQAQAAADALRNKPIAAVFSSPQFRTRQTAKIILAQHNNLSLHISHLLNEAHTPYDGHQSSEMIARNWDAYTGTDPKYEQPADVLTRLLRFIADMRQRFAGKHIIAVTHGDIIAFGILRVKGVPIIPESKQTLCAQGLADDYPAPASIATFIYQTPHENEVPAFEYMKPR